MKLFVLFLSLFAFASCAVVKDYGPAQPVDQAARSYRPPPPPERVSEPFNAPQSNEEADDPYSAPVVKQADPVSDSYGETRTEKKCREVEDVTYRQHCEKFEDEVCTTTPKESCEETMEENCSGVVTSKTGRKCFDVTEQRCSLKEEVKTRTIPVEIPIMKCKKAFENVCDTVYDSVSTTQSRNLCINAKTVKCDSESKTVYDRTCRTYTTFDCESSEATPVRSIRSDDGYSDQRDQMLGASSQTSGGYGAPEVKQQQQQGYSSTSNYGTPQPNCRKHQETRCYKTPRYVTVPECVSVADNLCKDVKELVPNVKARKFCRPEQKKVCALEKRTEQRPIKEYFYKRNCRSVQRQVCGDATQSALAPKCVPVMATRCSFTSVKSCEKVPKERCLQVPVKQKRMVCETVEVPKSY